METLAAARVPVKTRARSSSPARVCSGLRAAPSSPSSSWSETMCIACSSPLTRPLHGSSPPRSPRVELATLLPAERAKLEWRRRVESMLSLLSSSSARSGGDSTSLPLLQSSPLDANPSVATLCSTLSAHAILACRDQSAHALQSPGSPRPVNRRVACSAGAWSGHQGWSSLP